MQRIYFDASMKTEQICIANESTKQYIIKSFREVSDMLGLPVPRTHNQAEYLALIYAIFRNEQKDVEFVGDSQLVIEQMTGHYSVHRAPLYLYHDVAKELLKSVQTARFQWVPREQNVAGLILDGKVPHGYREYGKREEAEEIEDEMLCPFLSATTETLEPCNEQCGLFVPAVGKCAFRVIAEYLLGRADLRYYHELFKQTK